MEEQYVQTITLGNVLQARREQLRLSMQDLADMVGCNPSSVMRFEHGSRKPTPATLERLAQALDLLLPDLLTLGGYPPTAELPSLQPYLRAKYGLDEQTIAAISEYVATKASRYGAVGSPADGEDEHPDPPIND